MCKEIVRLLCLSLVGSVRAMCVVRTNRAVTLSLSIPVCAARCLSITLSSMYVIVRYSALSHTCALVVLDWVAEKGRNQNVLDRGTKLESSYIVITPTQYHTTHMLYIKCYQNMLYRGTYPTVLNKCGIRSSWSAEDLWNFFTIVDSVSNGSRSSLIVLRKVCLIR